ncbi:MAG: hypothetical protein K9N34_03735 [Candidatus Marinimicrobia bacterium]|nr:hypothetical protein [Candidatus Neomarinimicrobiota bacterium]MCF7840079.1 hypothetical protein [Candidatus Neomarinimicrobiota bacterium]
MARLSFGLAGQSANDLLAGVAVKIYDEEAEGFVASTNEADGYDFTVHDNNDGTYLVDGLPMGLYSVYVGSDQVPQDELSFFAFFNEDGLAHFRDAADTGGKVWHHKIDDTTPAADKLYSSQKVQNELDQKADSQDLQNYSPTTHNHDGVYAPEGHDHPDKAEQSDLNAHEAAANPHPGSASATPGAGLKSETGQKLALDYDSDDFGLESNRLSLRKAALESTYRFSPNMSLQQMLFVIDNTLRQLEGAAGGSGGYTQTLWNNIEKDDIPSGVLNGTGAQVLGETTYRHRVRVPFWKTPAIRQVVYYFETSVLASGDIGFVKLECGGLSIESDPIENTYDGNNPNYKALYLDVSGLANFQFHNLVVSMKVSGTSESMFAWNEQIVARTEITTLAGETSYANQNPVE